MAAPYAPLTVLPGPLAVKGPTSNVSQGGCKEEVTGEEGRGGRKWREGGKGMKSEKSMARR